MTWLPSEDEVAAKTEELLLKYNPAWEGANFEEHKLGVLKWSKGKFKVLTMHTYFENIFFIRNSWRGRIRACRGIGAALAEEEINKFDTELNELLKRLGKDKFEVSHQIFMYLFSPS